MTDTPTTDTALAITDLIHTGLPVDPETIDLPLNHWDINQLHAALTVTDTWKTAATAVGALIEQAIVADVQKHGTIRVGDEILATKQPDRRLLPDVDVIGWLGDLDAVRAAVNITARNLRITALRNLATERGLDPSVIDDTFYERPTDVEGEPILKLSRLPVGGRYTPKWLSRLAESERVQPRTKKETTDGQG